MKNREVKAIGLISGGLDSLLATLILKEQKINILGVNFYTGFCIYEMRKRKGISPSSDPVKIIRDLGIEVRSVDISREFMEILIKPEHGYGKFSNPCIDCRIMMLKRAKRIMNEEGAHFIYTGEVVGERPMTQMLRQLRIIEEESSCKGILLRPLSAKILPPTEPEIRGLVDRSKLYGIKGRSRRPQIKLAEKFGLREYPQPAGGCCFLTDETFARRFFDMKKHEKNFTLNDDEVSLLTTGRHFRISNRTKLIVGRNERENKFLLQFKETYPLIFSFNGKGPVGLLKGEINEEVLKLCGGIILRYTRGAKSGKIKILFSGSHEMVRESSALPPEEVDKFFI